MNEKRRCCTFRSNPDASNRVSALRFFEARIACRGNVLRQKELRTVVTVA